MKIFTSLRLRNLVSNTGLVKLGLLCLASLLAGDVWAAPTNDNFSNAIVISGDSGTTNGSNVGATTEPGEPYAGYIGASVWYKWTASTNETTEFDLQGSVFGTGQAYVLVYTNSASGISNLQLVAYGYIQGSSSSQQSFQAVAGQTYYISVAGYTNATGTIKLNWSSGPPIVPPPNGTFASAQVLTGDWGSVTNDNAGAVPDANAPNIAGFAPNAPLWYQWTPAIDGEVELDTIGSVDDAYGTPLNTVLGVFTGTSLATLSQVAANDNLFPVGSGYSSSSLSLAQINYSGSGDYAQYRSQTRGGGPGSSVYFSHYPLYYGPSHLRFNAKAGTTYYIAVDSQYAYSCLGYSLGNGPGTIVLNWAYKSSGVFRFASEDVDYWTALPTNSFGGGGGHLAGYPLYQAAQTESYPPDGTANDANSTILTYYMYNVPGVLVTVARVAGSTGRVMVDYQTVDGTYLAGIIPTNDAPAFSDVDYMPVSGTLVFDDYEMSKTIFIPLVETAWEDTSFQSNTVFGVQLSNPRLPEWPEPSEAGDVSPPRVDPNFSLALVRILNVNADPYGPDLVPVVVTNFNYYNTNILIPSGMSTQPAGITNSQYVYNPNLVWINAGSSNAYGGYTNGSGFNVVIDTNIPAGYVISNLVTDLKNGIYYFDNDGIDYSDPWMAHNPYGSSDLNLSYQVVDQGQANLIVTNVTTNMVVALYPTNVIINFEKAHYRVPEDVNNATNNGWGWTKVVIYAERFGTNGSDITLKYRVNNYLNYDYDADEEWNNRFPLQPGSDYAVPTPAMTGPDGTNSDFDLAQGTITFPSCCGSAVSYQPISFTVNNSSLTKFNKDFRIQLFQENYNGQQNVTGLHGMVAETTVTILFNDFNPPAGSVDEFYNADFNRSLAVPAGSVPQTIPQNDPNPGVSGVVNSLLVLPNNETLIAGDFSAYNGYTYPDAKPVNCIALIDATGALDPSFEPESGANGSINSLASSPGNQFVIGGGFTAFNGVACSYVARVNADGSLDTAFNPTVNGPVWATAVQPDGRIFIGGAFNTVNGVARNNLARLNTDGTLDTAFDPGTALNGPVYAIALPVASISFNNAAAGSTNEVDQTINLGLANAGLLTVNYNVTVGTSDMSVFYGGTNGFLIFDTGSVSNIGSFSLQFGPTNGLTTNVITIVMNQGGVQIPASWNYAGTITFGGGGQIMVGGGFGVSGQSYANIARFTSNGALDTTFSPIGGADNPVYALGLQPDGKVAVGGSFTHFNGADMNRIARLNKDGSLDATNFFVGMGANDVVWNITLQPNGTMYVGGQFSSFNGTHRLGFTRLYPNGTVDTTFLDTAYNQFAGLKRIYSYDAPAVYASGVQSDGNVMIGGTFDQVGGGQADTNVYVALDYEQGIANSFGDPNLWVEPKTRDGVRNRSSVARLIGGSTPGPGNVSFQTASFSANKSQSVLSVGLVRTNGMLGPVSANFSIQPSTALSGRDYAYNSAPPLFWVAWRYITTPTRLRSDGLYGINGFLRDLYNYLPNSDSSVNNLSAVTVSLIKNNQTSGNLSAQFQLANPSGADEFYLGGQSIPLGAALGPSVAPFTLIDDNKNAGALGFVSPVYSATNIGAVISLVRSNGTYGTVTMRASTTNGTALAGIDYYGITNLTVTFLPGVITNSFTVTNKTTGLVYTNFVEKYLYLTLRSLTGPSGGNVSFGLSNAVLRLINKDFQGYLTLSTNIYYGSESAGFISFVVNRVTGSAGTITVQYATTNGTALNGVDYTGSTNTLLWNNGDSSPRIISIPLINTGTVGASKSFNVKLSNPMLNGASSPGLFYVGQAPTNSITNAVLTIVNDNSYGAVQFSAPSYLVNENGGYATITVVRTGGTAGPLSVNFATSDGSNTVAGVNYVSTHGVLTFAVNQTVASFNVPVLDNGVPDPTNFYFNVTLSNPTNTVLGSPTNALVNILDAYTHSGQSPGSPDETFTPGMNGDVLALTLQTNGQILAGGNFTFVSGTPENSIARLNADGSLDSAGFLNGYSGANGAVQAIVCQTDNRVLIGGAFTTANGITRNHIARLMTDGSLDTSFNPGFGADGPVYALVETFVNGVRKLYAGGSFNSISGGTSPNFARFNNDGTLDPAFNAGSGPNGAVFAVAAYPTNSPFAGKVLIGGAFTNVNNFTLNHIARLNGDGSVDTNFDLNLGASDTVRAIAIQIDGRILIGGDFNTVNGVALNRVARLNADGSLDATFTANVGVGANSTVQAIAVQADNRIVLAGQFTSASGVTRNHITRLLPNGAVDTTINFGDGANGTIDALVIQPADQRFVIGGGFTQYDDQPHAHIARIYGGSMTGSGLLQFTSAAYQVDEKGGQALITVRRTGGTSGPNPDGTGNISVQFATTNGTAVAGVNYSAVATSLSFPPGEVLESVAVPVMDDGVVTAGLTVNLAITNPTAPAGIGGQPSAVLTIINDDSDVSFAKASDSVSQNVPAGFAAIDVLRLGTTYGACSVDFVTTTNGTAVAGVDFVPTNTAVTFNPGQTNVQVQVPILNNPRSTENRTVLFTLTNAVNAVMFSPSNFTLTITDTNVAPGQFCFSATSYSANESDGHAYIKVVRTNGTSGSASVTCSTVDNSTNGTAVTNVNYISTSQQLNFNPGDTTNTFIIQLVPNKLVQATVSLPVVLSNPSPGTSLIAPTNAILYILNNNVGFNFQNATNPPVSETNRFAHVPVQCLGNPTNPVSVYYATTNGTAIAGVNYTNVSGTLTFAVGETVQDILVPLIDDTNVTGDLTFTVSLSSPSVGTVLAAPSNSVVVVRDADAGLSFANPVASVSKNAGSLVVAVVCSNTNAEPVIVYSNGVPVTTPLSVQYSTADGTALANQDYTPTNGTLVFTNGMATNTFNVHIFNNSLVMGDRTFSLHLSNPTPPGQLVYPSNQVVTIIDNNSGLKFSSPTYTVLKSGGVPATITVLRVDNTNTVSSVDFATADGTAVAGLDYTATNGTFVFTNGETTRTFFVTARNNTVVQPDKTVLLQLSNPNPSTSNILIAPYAATLTIHDTSGSFVVPAGATLVSEGFQPPNGIIDPGETNTLSFAFRDAGGTDAQNLYATLLPINGISSPIPAGGMNYGNLTVNGPSASRPFTFTVSPGYTNSQQIVATFQLKTNGINGNIIGTNGFTFTLGTWTTTFSNTAPIIVNDLAIATPYPSIINVSNVGGVVVKATVTLTNLSHGSANDIDALLVSPSAQDTLLMSHVGTPSVNANHVTLTFDDAATNSLPSTGAITSGTNKPTAYPPLPLFP